MDSTVFSFILIVLIFLVIRNQKNRAVAAQIAAGKRGNRQMQELAKTMIGKECLIYTFSGSTVEGTILQVTDSALLVQGKKEKEVMNLSFVTRIREYPRNKKGKKKTMILD